MIERWSPRWLATLVTGLLACAHAPASAVVERPVWPPAPEAAQLRWLGSYPDPNRGAPELSTWRKLVDLVLGLESRPESDAPALQRPFGVAVDARWLWITDPDARQVLRVDWRDGAGSPVACEGHSWGAPMGLALAPDGALYVADAGAGCVLRIDPAGGCRSIGTGSLLRPTGVAASRDRLWVSDPPTHRVLVFDSSGRELGRFGDSGETQAMLHFPTAIALSLEGVVLVTDALNFRVAAYSAEGRFLEDFGREGFGRPKAIAVDPKGRTYVSDAEQDQVLIFDRGQLELSIGGSGAGPGQLAVPAGLAISGGMLFVASSFNRRVEIYELLGGDP